MKLISDFIITFALIEQKKHDKGNDDNGDDP